MFVHARNSRIFAKMATSVRKQLVNLQSEHVGENESDEIQSGSGEESEDSDAELQKAFAAGLLKPGLNIVTHGPKKCINDVARIKEALVQLRQDLPWIERLDVVSGEASASSADREEEEEISKKTTAADDVHNDFKREMKFYRQGQAAALEAIPRLQKLGLPTKRPEDYFAEMAKSDEHMRKVRKKLIGKQLSIERSEKAKKLRDLKKFGKKVQHEVLLKRQKEKKKLMESIKKFRRGKKDALDILEDLDRKPGSSKIGKKGVPDEHTVQKYGRGKKREYRDKKFGEGGKKRGTKRNTKESTYDESRGNTSKRIREQGANLFKPGKKYQAQRKKQMKMNRPGKPRRQQAKSRRKK